MAFAIDREEPIWPVTQSAKNFRLTKRLSSLAEPRYPPPNAWPPGYQFFRPPISEVPPAALHAKPSGRLEQLSSPVARKVHKEGDADVVNRTVTAPSSTVPPAALRANCTDHVQVNALLLLLLLLLGTSLPNAESLLCVVYFDHDDGLLDDDFSRVSV